VGPRPGGAARGGAENAGRNAVITRLKGTWEATDEASDQKPVRIKGEGRVLEGIKRRGESP